LYCSGSPTSLVFRTGSNTTSAAVTVERDGVSNQQQLTVVSPRSCDPISHLLITTKAFDVRAAVAGIAHLLNESSVVVLLVNGMGLAEQLLAAYPHLDIYCGTTTEGAYRIAPQHICHAGRGETRIGRQGQHTAPGWFATWTNAIAPCHWDSDINSALWSKLAVNCIINPLTAVHRCPNGELAQREPLVEQVAQLCDEVSLICDTAGHPALAAALAQNVARVINQTAGNRSSMLQDVEQGRPTEIDYINGFLLQVARQLGIDAPLNSALVRRVKNRDH
jgi:2-dehydropantoate 2-reductase